MAGINAGVAGTLGGGVWTVEGEIGGGGLANRRGAWRIGGFTGRILDGRMVGGALGLQLLATTVSSLSSLSYRMWDGLLLHRSWTGL
jgi:hypothetical protein